MKKKSITELGHSDLLLFTSPVLLKCQYFINVEQNLVTFNENDVQMDLFQIYVTFYTN